MEEPERNLLQKHSSRQHLKNTDAGKSAFMHMQSMAHSFF
ncbi:hypothetical protein DFO77_11923 [Marinilabilia salmonicolor]|jgi:hypothetical protein|uniref:Uncharacterized protein n=1 Tax=Marinilabilia salmonicolor TaxID=989 RepID=A0A2T0XPQ5_9BACT|nr:hypothetical protein BY457_104136 [Marinilabilia salmonicolor]RCW31057.1 hypothetical protein DFO77_11923 [Marinilabilia salmonicolor]